MTYADRLLAASAKGEADGAKVVELIVRGLERSEAEAKELFDILTKLNWNRKVTREQWDYITGFRCGVFWPAGTLQTSSTIPISITISPTWRSSMITSP